MSFVVSAAAGLVAVAALTSGDPADKAAGLLLATVALALLLVAIPLLVIWWRLAGRLRRFRSRLQHTCPVLLWVFCGVYTATRTTGALPHSVHARACGLGHSPLSTLPSP